MKDYKENDAFIGDSDIGAVICVGYQKDARLTSQILNFGEDGRYVAHITENFKPEDIPEHYQKRLSFNEWLRIYDDNGIAYQAKGKQIDIYRAGERGCLINVINDDIVLAKCGVGMSFEQKKEYDLFHVSQ